MMSRATVSARMKKVERSEIAQRMVGAQACAQDVRPGGEPGSHVTDVMHEVKSFVCPCLHLARVR